jgi:chemotaxis protein MotB
MKYRLILVMAVALAVALTGCSNKKLEEQQVAQIADLQAEVEELHGQLDTERQRSQELNSELSEALSEQRAQEQVWMEQKDMLTTVTLDGEVAFGSGSASIRDEGQTILDRIFEIVSSYPDRDVLIEGHTDDVPIAEKWQHRYKSNWELSSARAHAVLHFAVQNYGMDPGRVAAVGYGAYRPLVSNGTPEGRATNRRVVITVGPRTLVKALP